MEELGQVKRIDDGEFMEFVKMEHLDDDADNDNGQDDDSNLELFDSTIFADLELFGQAMWHANPEFRDKARDMAAELIIQFMEGSLGVTHSLPTYVSRRYKDGDTFDLNIDATIEHAIEHPQESIAPYIYQRRQSRFPVVLMLDTSFSMSGSKLLIAGLAVATLSKLIPSKDLCVMGFAKNVYPIKTFDEEISSFSLISRIFGLVPAGPTNLSKALIEGAKLVNPFTHNSRLIFLTDADPTTGKNPLVVAGTISQLDILLFPYGNEWLAKRLAFEAGLGNLFPLKKIDDVFFALQQVLTVLQ
ncbi:MAG: VWA domain-containing protein [Candidatus Heimdallarchaeota archaeon]|nr:VWA domain-containing protein [Candidatus Heimdallarchaeota archaeon]